MESSDVRNILNAYQQDVKERIRKLFWGFEYEPGKYPLGTMDDIENYINMVLDKALEELTNGKRS